MSVRAKSPPADVVPVAALPDQVDALTDQQEAHARATTTASAIATLVADLQARGLRIDVPFERRQGGAGPTDSGMLWVGGFPLTVPTDNAAAAASPYVLRAEDEGYAIFRGSERLADASACRLRITPRYI